jgi:hypothetical protein
MHQLTVGPAWSTQISQIRNAHSEDTNLIRFGNNFYRLCRDTNDSFLVSLFPSDNPLARPLEFEMREKDFYINELAGAPIVNYAATFDAASVSAGTLDSAIYDLVGNKVNGVRAFTLRTLIVFCVAESIRNDHLATALEQTMRASQMHIGGVDKQLMVEPWWNLSHQWGQACDAIHQQFPVQSPKDTRYIDLSKIPPHLRRCAATTKVLKQKS